MQLGYVGLGNMGAALARRLLRRHKMRLYDLRPQAMARLADLGGIACQSPKALAAESDLVMTCLPTSADVREAIFSADGLAAGLKKGSIIADMTTGDPNATRAMADALKSAGITLIDAPSAVDHTERMREQLPSWWERPSTFTRACNRFSKSLAPTFFTVAILAPAIP